MSNPDAITGRAAQAVIDASYLVFAGGVAPTPDVAPAVRGQVQGPKDAPAAWHAGYDRYTFADTRPMPARCSRPRPTSGCGRSPAPTTRTG